MTYFSNVQEVKPDVKPSAMNVYDYIANVNPDAANSVCKKYGYYQIENVEELAWCLKQIVADNGEESLKKIMELHPEKEVILELFEVKPEPKKEEVSSNPIMMNADGNKDCGCGCGYRECRYRNADGAASTGIASQTNMIILVAAMIVSISIISMKK
jgi:hypothetical protein